MGELGIDLYLKTLGNLPIIIDVCFVKDDRAVQMLSAEIATKGRTLPLYPKVFKEEELKEQTQHFYRNLLIAFLRVAKSL